MGLLFYLECPYQFALRRVAGIQPSVGPELGFGKGIHELVRHRCESNNTWSPNELSEKIKTHVNLPYMSVSGKQQSRNAIETRMKVLEELGVFNSETEAEIPIELVLKSGIIHGIIDNVFIRSDGTLMVRDWKSSIHPALIAPLRATITILCVRFKTAGEISIEC